MSKCNNCDSHVAELLSTHNDLCLAMYKSLTQIYTDLKSDINYLISDVQALKLANAHSLSSTSSTSATTTIQQGEHVSVAPAVKLSTPVKPATTNASFSVESNDKPSFVAPPIVESPSKVVVPKPASVAVTTASSVLSLENKSLFAGSSILKSPAEVAVAPVASGANKSPNVSAGSLFGGKSLFGGISLPPASADAGKAPGGFSFLPKAPLAQGGAKLSFGVNNDELFKTPGGNDKNKESDDDDDKEDDFVPDVHFKPVIPLPALVEAKTGEEEEEALFNARCKLYRYDKDTRENKERGVGEIKILKNKTTGRHRCVMRRDQVLKLCANFQITSGMKISQKPNLPTAYTWACKDFSEEVDGKDEVLCARFKDANIAQEFNKTFLGIASPGEGTDPKLTEAKQKVEAKKPEAPKIIKEEPKQSPVTALKKEQEQPKVDEEKRGGQPKEDAKKEEEKKSSIFASFSALSTTSPAADSPTTTAPQALSVTSAAKTTVTTAPTTLTQSTNKSLFAAPPAFKPVAGAAVSTTASFTSNSNTSPNTGGSLFGGKSLFGGGTKTNASFADIAGKGAAGFSFLSKPSQSATSADLSFGTKNAQLFKSSATNDEKGKESDDDDDKEDDFVPDVHFKPVIPLPELIDVKTGEEEEEVLFNARCKLYRYDKDTRENKERGVGEIKILKNKTTGRHRCVMRRDQVLKLCANFQITSGMKISQKPNLPTAYTWACKDYSEEVEGRDEIFCARFKEATVAKTFSEKFINVASLS